MREAPWLGSPSNNSFPPAPRQSAPRRALLAVTTLCGWALSNAQVFTVQREKLAPKEANLTTVQPTSVQLATTPSRSGHGSSLSVPSRQTKPSPFVPFRWALKGVVLHANGPLSPSGTAYAEELQKYGISSKPGDRVVITKFEVKPDRILFEFNDGPEKHHHIHAAHRSWGHGGNGAAGSG